jgi:hypothetical protein
MKNETGGIWLAIIGLLAVMVAAGAGIAFHAAGASLPTMISASGASFAATITLGLRAREFLSAQSK